MQRQDRALYLLLSLALLIFAFPFVEDIGEWFSTGLLILILVISIFTVAATRYEKWIGGVLTAVIAWTSLLVPEDDAFNVSTVGPVLGIIYFAYVVTLMLRHIFLHTKEVSLGTIYLALSAYLMMGVMWALAFTVLSVAQPGAYALNGEAMIVNAGSFERFLGFSFVTLTTLGYGNIVPVTDRATSIAVAEAVIGQIYLTVLLARLVAMEIAQRRGDSGEDGNVAVRNESVGGPGG